MKLQIPVFSHVWVLASAVGHTFSPGASRLRIHNKGRAPVLASRSNPTYGSQFILASSWGRLLCKISARISNQSLLHPPSSLREPSWVEGLSLVNQESGTLLGRKNDWSKASPFQMPQWFMSSHVIHCGGWEVKASLSRGLEKERSPC